MSRPVVAIVTGFTKSWLLLEHSMAPLRALRRKGVIDHIYYVTWDKPELDAILAPITAMPEIQLVRVREPQVDSPVRYHKSFACQSRGVAAGLERITDPEALILKLRPDFIASEEFLAAKLLSFDFWS